MQNDMVTRFVKRLIKTEKSIVLPMRAYVIRAIFMLQHASIPALWLHIFYQIQLISDIHWQRIRDVTIVMSWRHFLHFGHLGFCSSGQKGSSTSVVMTIVKSFLEHLSGRYYLISTHESKRQVDECSLIHVYQEQ